MALRRNRQLAIAAALVVATASGGCSGESTDLGETTYTGIVFQPAVNCDGCDNVDAVVALQVLTDAGPETVKCVRTRESGVYDTGDEDIAADVFGCAGPRVSLADPGQTQTNIIQVALTEDAGRSIGGIVRSEIGLSTSKDFNVPTQIACVASVRLTTTALLCPGRSVIAAGQIGELQISNLERAASSLSSVEVFPRESVEELACAIIECTDGGNESCSQCIAEQGPDGLTGVCVQS